jgi:hypothetical protein
LRWIPDNRLKEFIRGKKPWTFDGSSKKPGGPMGDPAGDIQLLVQPAPGFFSERA